jgi:hypothetical protein
VDIQERSILAIRNGGVNNGEVLKDRVSLDNSRASVRFSNLGADGSVDGEIATGWNTAGNRSICAGSQSRHYFAHRLQHE